MKKQIKVIIAITVGLIGMIIQINGLFNKKDIQIDTTGQETTIEVQISNETTTTSTTTTKKVKITKKVVKTTKKVVPKKVVKSTNGFRLTHYGYDCCKTGRTATGYDISKTQYYNDSTYGEV